MNEEIEELIGHLSNDALNKIRRDAVLALERDDAVTVGPRTLLALIRLARPSVTRREWLGLYNALPTAKQVLLGEAAMPAGASPESLPAGMEQNPFDDRGHGTHVPRTFLRVTPLDRAGRRALWIRFEPYDPNDEALLESNGEFVELRAGREGDDARLLLTAGEVLTRERVAALVDVLLTMKFGLDADGSDGWRDRAERAEVQLAGCGAAAMGAVEPRAPEAKPGDYGWSPAYADVVKIRREVEQLRGDPTGDYRVEYEPDWTKYPKLARVFEHRPPQNVYWDDLRQLLRDARADAVQYVRDVRAEELAKAREDERAKIRERLGAVERALEQIVESNPDDARDDSRQTLTAARASLDQVRVILGST
jgi:hypothetical protein